jgi:UDP-3-O-[3-hydroxymyristoyl] glucosamine N-acyltransferase
MKASEIKQQLPATLIRVPDAYSAFATLLTKYQELMTQQLSGIQQPSYIAETAVIGENAFIGAFVYLGEKVRIGNNVKIFPGCCARRQCSIGDNSILHAGSKDLSRLYHWQTGYAACRRCGG